MSPESFLIFGFRCSNNSDTQFLVAEVAEGKNSFSKLADRCRNIVPKKIYNKKHAYHNLLSRKSQNVIKKTLLKFMEDCHGSGNNLLWLKKQFRFQFKLSYNIHVMVISLFFTSIYKIIKLKYFVT